MYRAAVILMLALGVASCALSPGEIPHHDRARVTIPEDLKTCPAAPAIPAAPGLPRTTESIAAWAVDLNVALSRAEAARAECAGKLRRLNALIEQE